MTARTVRRVGCLAAMGALAGLEFHRVFGWGPVAVRVLGSAILAAAVPSLCCWRGFGRVPISASLSLLLGVAYLEVVVIMTAPAGAPGGLVDGLVNGWSRLLTTTIPAPPRGDLLLLPIGLTWLGTLVGVEMALRTRLAVGALVPSAVAYVVGLLFTVGTAGSRLVPAVAWVALAVGSLRLADVPASTKEPTLTPMEGRRAGVRLPQVTPPTAVFLVGVVVLAGLVGPRLPGAGSTQPVDPREHQSPPREDVTAVNPMALLSQWARQPDKELFVVRAARPLAWRLAVLDAYDGAQWSAHTMFSATGAKLPPDPVRGPGVGGVERVEQTVVIRDLRGVWLPAAARPVEIGGMGAFVDPESGVLARPTGLTKGLEYRVVSERLRDASCETATVSDPGPLAIETTEKNAPLQQAIAGLSAEITGAVASPCERARALERYLRSSFRFDPEAVGGSHLRAMADFLTVPEHGRGTSEQFASAFALLGRYAGLPTRVVVGFHAGEETTRGTWLVRSGDAFAWAEVRFDGLGWVAFDPTPLDDEGVEPPEKAAEEEAEVDAPPDQGPAAAPPRVVERETEEQRAGDEGRSLAVQLLVGFAVVLAAVLVLIGMLALVAHLGRRRRWRRRRSVPGRRRQIVSAWWEALDALADRGLDADRTRTAAQWVDAGSGVVDEGRRSDLGLLATLVNAALFDPEGPGADEPERAWECAAAVSRAARSGMTGGQWLRWLLDPRPWLARVPPPLDDVVVAPSLTANA